MTYYDYGSMVHHLRTRRTINRNGDYWRENGRAVRDWLRRAMAAHAGARARHARYLKRSTYQCETDTEARRFWIEQARDLRTRANWRRLP